MANLLYTNQYVTTTLNVGGGIDSSQTTGIILTGVTGIDITKPGMALVNYADPLVTSTCEWIEYSSIDGSNELQGVVRGSEGFSAKAHSNGVTIAFPLSESHINRIATALSIGGVATNGVTTTLDEDTMSSNSATALATQQSIKAYVDANSGENYTISASRGSSAETITLSGITSLRFRNATAGTGDYSSVTVTNPSTLVIPSTATMGMTNSVLSRLWLIAMNDGGTVRLGVVNTKLTDGIFALKDDLLLSATAIDTASDSAGVIYAGSAVTTKAIRVLGYLEYTLAAVGTWDTAPSKIEVYQKGDKLPGDTVQIRLTQTGAVATGTTVMPFDDTIPQNTEGVELMTQAIIPTSVASKLLIESIVYVSHTAVDYFTGAFFQDSVANALAVTSQYLPTVAQVVFQLSIRHEMVAGTVSSTTFKLRVGSPAAGTLTFNGFGGNRSFGGVLASHIRVTEIMV